MKHFRGNDATTNEANFPGAVGSSPYGPSFGSQYGILNAVGSYKIASSPYDLSYLYNGVAAAGEKGAVDILKQDSRTETHRDVVE